jgi:hypothetical protein
VYDIVEFEQAKQSEEGGFHEPPGERTDLMIVYNCSTVQEHARHNLLMFTAVHEQKKGTWKRRRACPRAYEARWTQDVSKLDSPCSEAVDEDA